MPERKGQYTVMLSSRPTVLGYAAVVGKKEGEGPLGRVFDAVFDDTTMGEKTWEKAESAFQKEAFTRALNKAGFSPSQVNFLFAGDLLNQNIASTFGLRETNVPLLGQFGACSTMAQTLALAAIFVDSGAADVCSAVTSSHFCTGQNASSATRWNMGDSVRRPRSGPPPPPVLPWWAWEGTARISNRSALGGSPISA